MLSCCSKRNYPVNKCSNKFNNSSIVFNKPIYSIGDIQSLQQALVKMQANISKGGFLNLSSIFFDINKQNNALQWPNFNYEALKKIFNTNKTINETAEVIDDEIIDETAEVFGYSYDDKQDIFFSNIDAWQRKYGFCKLYDEAAAPLGMIMDCEPIPFEYGGKKWMIELWKGQYDLTTGCEIGIYNTEEINSNIMSRYKVAFYQSASDKEMLQMSYKLKKDGKPLFSREDRHWWLTGFRIGEFSEPSQLTAEISITLKNNEMCNAFIKGLKSIGYSDKEFKRDINTISLIYDRPHVQQPRTRTGITDWIIQRKNEALCKEYNELTKGYDNMPDKIKAIRKQSPELYKKIINIGKTQKLFKVFDTLENYLD